jgi:hypothetical protein
MRDVVPVALGQVIASGLRTALDSGADRYADRAADLLVRLLS